MNEIFNICVDILVYIANITGLTYEEVNVIIFCFLWPVLTVYLFYKAFIKSAYQSSYPDKSFRKSQED